MADQPDGRYTTDNHPLRRQYDDPKYADRRFLVGLAVAVVALGLTALLFFALDRWVMQARSRAQEQQLEAMSLQLKQIKAQLEGAGLSNTEIRQMMNNLEAHRVESERNMAQIIVTLNTLEHVVLALQKQEIDAQRPRKRSELESGAGINDAEMVGEGGARGRTRWPNALVGDQAR